MTWKKIVFYTDFIKLSYIKFVYVFGETSDKGLSLYFYSEIINSKQYYD